MGRSRLCVIAFALLAGLSTSAAPAIAADEPIYTLPGATVTANVAEDGSVKVTQELTFRFNDEGHGAYIDIPRPRLSGLTDITVSENGRPYRKRPGAEIGVERPSDTYGEQTCSVDGAHRVVWYFDAEPGSTRTFRVDYTMHRAVTAYERHAFLQLPVWGKNWSQTLDRLDVTVRLPRTGRAGETYLAKGEPADVLEPTVNGSRQVTKATAEQVGGGRAVTLHLAFPAAQLDLPEESASSSPVRVREGDGEAQLDRMRKGEVAAAYLGTDCPLRSASGGGDSTGFGEMFMESLVPLAIGVVLVVSFVQVVRNRDRDRGLAHHSRGRRRSSRSSYYSSSGSTDSGGSGGYSGGGGGDSGGGGGAW